jgi:hypothetical protein
VVLLSGEPGIAFRAMPLALQQIDLLLTPLKARRNNKFAPRSDGLAAGS